MNFNVNSWLGQVTTGHGAMILGPTLLAAASGTITWSTAVPLLAAGVVGLLWPENTALQTATRTVATDVEALIAAYRTGLHRGAADDTQAVPPGTNSAGAGAAAIIAMLAAAGVTLAACANQTPAQQVALQTSVASGLLCVADATGKVVATASTNDSNTMKAVNAAVAAGNALLTDAACQTALSSGATALAQPAITKP